MADRLVYLVQGQVEPVATGQLPLDVTQRLAPTHRDGAAEPLDVTQLVGHDKVGGVSANIHHRHPTTLYVYIRDHPIFVQKIEKERAIKDSEIKAGQEVQTSEIEKAKILEIAKQHADQESEIAAIQKRKASETVELERSKTIELTEQQNQIEIAVKSEERSKARAAADRARAEAVKAGEEVISAKEKWLSTMPRQEKYLAGRLLLIHIGLLLLSSQQKNRYS